MFHLADLRKTRVWQEAHEEGIEKGTAETKRQLVARCLAKGMPHKQIADLLEMPVNDIRRLAKSSDAFVVYQ